MGKWRLVAFSPETDETFLDIEVEVDADPVTIIEDRVIDELKKAQLPPNVDLSVAIEKVP